nr:WecB/TagA/CpsF family glycosyltransferase [Litoribacter alkaliphilus]
MNVEIDNLSLEESLKRLKKVKFVVTTNIDHLYNLRENPAFLKAYKEADMVLCDSKIISAISGFLFNSRLRQIAGSDYFPAACKFYNKDPSFKIFLLGGTTPMHAKKAAANLKKKCKARIVGYFSPPFGFEKNEDEIERIIHLINESGANLIAVGLGSPKQELLISRLRHSSLHNCTFMAIGATIDFQSGLLKRCPRVYTNIGLEWFYRFVQEPRRLFKRYFINGPQIILDLMTVNSAKHH